MRTALASGLVLGLVWASFATEATAQFGNAWAQFEKAPELISAASPISDSNTETDFRWADLDKNGRMDLVIVRSVPFIFVGKRTCVLLMNEGGVLVDRTAQYATQSDVVGDQGFLTPTQNRDVVIADVDGDSWLDVVTAPDQPVAGDPKSITHPRVYRNLGQSGGAWLGLKYEEARIPQLLHATSGVPVHPKFMAVAAGDVNGDGALDLYFGDHDYVAMFVAEATAVDTNDRLLLNDGNGFFTDGSKLSMSPAMLESKYCNSVAMADYNLDGVVDRVKQTTHDSPNSVHLAYNDPAMPGKFKSTVRIYNGSPYFINDSDLNGDGRLDLIISDNNADRFLLNLSTAPSGDVVWSSPKTYQFLSGGDDGFGADGLGADLDLDGWNDVFISDVDPEIAGYNRRLHIYHNRGGTVGGDVQLVEERASTNDHEWVGVVGMTPQQMKGTHDVGVFDVDGDGLPDIFSSRSVETVVWRQVKPFVDLGLGLPGVSGAPVLSGTGSLQPGTSGTVALANAAPNAQAIFFLSATATPTPFFGGTLLTVPLAIQLPFTTDGAGGISVPFVVPAGINPFTVYMQVAIADAAAVFGVALSNALKLHGV